MTVDQLDLHRFRRDTSYFHAHRDELLKRYPEQWVAIFNEAVVGASDSYDDVLDQVEAKGVDLGIVFIGRATAKDELLILPT